MERLDQNLSWSRMEYSNKRNEKHHRGPLSSVGLVMADKDDDDESIMHRNNNNNDNRRIK